MFYASFGKRFLDLGISLFLLLFFSPFFLILSILISVSLKGSPFFFQARPGKDGHVFFLVKFKTMLDLRGQDGDFLPDENRIFSLGKFIRKTSLDELPQLINVLKGEMSIVGPRPLLVEYLPLYTDYQSQRHSVRPGITGLAQINGRNTISWEKKFEYDVWYVKNLTLALDLKILAKTLVKVLIGKGVSQSGHVTTGKFTGNL